MNLLLDNELPAIEAFEDGKHEIRSTDEKGKPVAYVLLSDNTIARVKTGRGGDVEAATLISGGNQSKYFSALMAGCVTINKVPVIMEDLSELDMKSYMRIQVAFADINF